MELAFQALLVVDARQSAMIRRESHRYYEKNRLVERYGNKYFVAAAVHAASAFDTHDAAGGGWSEGVAYAVCRQWMGHLWGAD